MKSNYNHCLTVSQDLMKASVNAQLSEHDRSEPAHNRPVCIRQKTQKQTCVFLHQKPLDFSNSSLCLSLSTSHSLISPSLTRGQHRSPTHCSAPMPCRDQRCVLVHACVRNKSKNMTDFCRYKTYSKRSRSLIWNMLSLQYIIEMSIIFHKCLMDARLSNSTSIMHTCIHERCTYFLQPHCQLYSCNSIILIYKTQSSASWLLGESTSLLLYYPFYSEFSLLNFSGHHNVDPFTQISYSENAGQLMPCTL